MTVRGWLLVLVAAAAVAMAATHRRLASSERAIHFDADGYTEIVNRSIVPHLCAADRADADAPDPCARSVTRGFVVPNSTDYVVAWRGGANGGVEQTFRNFEERSALRDDRADARVFRFTKEEDGQSLRLLRRLHQQSLPFSDEREWLGSVTYSVSRLLPRLVAPGPRRQIVFHPPAPDLSPCVTPRRVTSFDGEVESAACFDWIVDDTLAVRAWAYPIGSRQPQEYGVVVSRPQRLPEGATVIINGRRLSGEALVAMRSGDWLEIRSTTHRIRYILEYAEEGLLSGMGMGAHGRYRETVSDVRVDSIVRPLVGAMNDVVAEGYRIADRNGAPPPPQLRELQERDVALTLDKFVQAAAHDALRSWMQRVKRDNAPHGREQPWRLRRRMVAPPRAALLVADIDSGDVLAAASYPDAEELEHEIDVIDARANRAVGDDRTLLAYHRDRLQRAADNLSGTNHNLTHHQIGSVTKPLFALTVGSDPILGRDFLHQSVRCTGKQGEYDASGKCLHPALIEGLPIGCFDDEPHGDRVDLGTYLAHSCHTFQFVTGAHALQALVGNRDGVEVCREENLGTLLANPAGTTSFARWREYFDASWSQQNYADPYLRATTVWHALSSSVDDAFSALQCATNLAPENHLPALEARRPATFQPDLAEDAQNRIAGLAPNAVCFEGASLNRCVQHYASWLKGGGTNRWSNVLVAQSLARLATGTRVELHFDRNVAPGARARRFPILPQPEDEPRFEDARHAILAGLGRVITAGTGNKNDLPTLMRAWLDDLHRRTGSYFGLYAKTGSSDRLRPVLQRWNRRKQRPITDDVWFKTANLALVIARCNPSPDGPWSNGSLACRAIPAAGEPWQGVIVYVWGEDVGNSRVALELFAPHPSGRRGTARFPDATARLLAEIASYLGA